MAEGDVVPFQDAKRRRYSMRILKQPAILFGIELGYAMLYGTTLRSKMYNLPKIQKYDNTNSKNVFFGRLHSFEH